MIECDDHIFRNCEYRVYDICDINTFIPALECKIITIIKGDRALFIARNAENT